MHELVDELCKCPGQRCDARRHAWRAPGGPTRQLPAQMPVTQWAARRSGRDRVRTDTRELSTRDLWMTVTGQRPRPSSQSWRRHRRRSNFRDDADVPDPDRPAMDGSHWLVSLISQVPETPVAAWPARVPGRGRRCWPWGEQGPHDLSGVAWCGGVAPLVTERADDVQSATGLGEGTGSSRHRSRRAQVGDRAQQGGPGPEQAEPEPGIAGYRQGVPQRAGHQLRHHDRDIVAAFCGAPPVQGGEGKVPGCAD